MSAALKISPAFLALPIEQAKAAFEEVYQLARAEWGERHPASKIIRRYPEMRTDRSIAA
jgi:hypothetical protein